MPVDALLYMPTGEWEMGGITYRFSSQKDDYLLPKNKVAYITVKAQFLSKTECVLSFEADIMPQLPIILTAHCSSDETVEFLDENGENLQSLLGLSPPYLLEFLAQVKDGQTKRVFKGLCWYNDDYI